MPAAYAPAPKNAACPSDGIPAWPMRRSSESANVAYTSMSRSTVVANGDDSQPVDQYGNVSSSADAATSAAQETARLICPAQFRAFGAKPAQGWRVRRLAAKPLADSSISL